VLSFNSLYEILMEICRRQTLWLHFQFSLWDSGFYYHAIDPAEVIFQFSLWDSTTESYLFKHYVLSILFMRFDIHSANVCCNGNITFSFNSLYEIRKHLDVSSIPGYDNFQFSLWDSTPHWMEGKSMDNTFYLSILFMRFRPFLFIFRI